MENCKNYAETLESYLIPAQEGFGSTVLKVLGFTVKAIIAFPFILIGGVIVVSGIHCANEARKLKKAVRKNKGNYSDYSGAAWSLLSSYKKDITGIQEPKEFTKVIPQFRKAVEFAKSADVIRKDFLKINPLDVNSDASYQKIYDRIESLGSTVRSFKCVDIDKIDKSDLVTSQPDASNLMAMCKFESDATNILFANTSDCQYIFPWYAYSDKQGEKMWDDICDNPRALECVDAYDELVEEIETVADTYDLITKCNFAVNPKAKPKK